MSEREEIALRGTRSETPLGRVISMKDVWTSVD
jgi:hypothetical protein